MTAVFSDRTVFQRQRWFLFGLVALFLVITQPDYMVRLLDNGMGRTILSAGIGAWLLGSAWFQRLTRFDF